MSRYLVILLMAGRMRTRKAAETPGAIAGNELVQVEKKVGPANALLNSRRQVVKATEAMTRSLNDTLEYLQISAPFDGVVTERLVHPDALVGPSNDVALLVVQQISHLRLVAPVPEEDVSGIERGARVEFEAPAWPARQYFGRVERSIPKSVRCLWNSMF